MKTALVIIDIQNDYFESGNWELEGSAAASVNAKRILSYFREKELPVIHVSHVSLGKDDTFFLPNTYGVEIHESVEPCGGEHVVVKNFQNSFQDTVLDKLLKAFDITDLTICGMMTDCCVTATSIGASEKGYKSVVIGDACAAKKRAVHDKALDALNGKYAEVISTEEFFNRCC